MMVTTRELSDEELSEVKRMVEEQYASLRAAGASSLEGVVWPMADRPESVIDEP